MLQSWKKYQPLSEIQNAEVIQQHPRSLRFRNMVFAHLEPHIFIRTALPNDLSTVMGDDTPDLAKLVRFDQELK